MPASVSRYLSQVEEQQPYVLLISSVPDRIREKLSKLLQNRGLELKVLNINPDLLGQVEKILEENNQLYKIIIINALGVGTDNFEKVSAENKILYAFLKNFEANWQFTDPPEIIFLSSYLKKINSIDQPQLLIEDLIGEKQRFIQQLLLNFPQSSFFLAEDLFLDLEHLSYPYKIFFSKLSEQVLVDPQSSFYWTDQDSFFKTLEQQLFKPDKGKRYLLLGQRFNSSKILEKIVDYYQRYFQIQLKIQKTISSEEKDELLNNFVKVKINSNYLSALDELVRELPEFKTILAEQAVKENINANSQSSPSLASVTFNEEAKAKHGLESLSTNVKTADYGTKRELEINIEKAATASVKGGLENKQSSTPVGHNLQKEFKHLQLENKQKEFVGQKNAFSQEKQNVSFKDRGSNNQLNLDFLRQRTKSPVSNIDKQESESSLKNSNQQNESLEKINKIDHKLEEIFGEEKVVHKQKRLIDNVKISQKIKKKTKKRKLLFAFGSFILFLSSLSLLLYFAFSFNQKYISKKLYTAIKDSIYIENETDKIELNKLQGFSKDIVENPLFLFLRKQNAFYGQFLAKDSLSSSVELEEIINLIVESNSAQESFNQALLNTYRETLRGEGDLSSNYQQMTSAYDLKNEKIQAINGILSNTSPENYPEEERADWLRLQQLVQEQAKNQNLNKKALEAWQQLILEKGRRNILIVFQDNSELRAGGGYISSVWLLTFDNGFLSDQQFLDTDQIDGSNFGQKVAPEEVKEVLGEEQLYFRDSNWAADFAKANQEIIWYVEQGMAREIDLTIALNYKSTKALLAEFGPIQLNNGEQINQENFYGQLESSLAEATPKDAGLSYASQIHKKLMDKILELQDVDRVARFFSIIGQSLIDKESMMQSKDPDLQQAFKSNVWSGEMLKSICPDNFSQDSCFLDEFYQVESNVGINKVNHYLSQEIEHNLGIGKDFIRHKQIINFNNQARSNIWPLGSYHNYIRFYLPQDANLEKLSLDGREVDQEQIRQYIEGDRLVIGLRFEVPVLSRRKLELTYVIKNNMKLPFSYVFLDQKQPGIEEKRSKYNIVFDDSFNPQFIAPTANYLNKIISFENNNDKHFVFAVKFQ